MLTDLETIDNSKKISNHLSALLVVDLERFKSFHFRCSQLS